MADQKLSELSAETDFDYDDLLYLVRGGNSRKIAGADFLRSLYDPRYSMSVFEDWIQSLSTTATYRQFDVFLSSFTINASQLSFPTANGSLGAGRLTNSSATGTAYITLFDSVTTSTARYCFVPGTLPTICEWRVRFPLVPSATDPAYYCRLGMRSIPVYTTNDANCHGVWAELYHNGSAQILELVAEAAGTKTTASASVGVTADTWHRITVAYTTSNAYMFLDGTQIATLSTGLPTSGSAPHLFVRKTAGASTVTVDVDYVWAFQLLANGR